MLVYPAIVDKEPRGRLESPRLTREQIVDAALTLFSERGYRGTTIDDIGRAAGVRGPSLYHHVGSKQEILADVMLGVMGSLLADHRDAIARTSDVTEQLRLAIEAHVRYHARHRREAFVGNREIGSLEEPSRSFFLGKRDEYERALRAILDRGAAEGRFDPEQTRLASYAILDMGIGVATWFRPDGSVSEDEVVRRYGELALRIAARSGAGGGPTDG